GADLAGSLGNFLNGNLGLNQFLFNNWVKTAVSNEGGGKGDLEIGVAASISVPIYTNTSQGQIGHVPIKQDAASRPAVQSLDVRADTVIDVVDMTGNVSLELSPDAFLLLRQGGRTPDGRLSPIDVGTRAAGGFGGSVLVLSATNTTTATIGGGAKIFIS